MTQKPFRPRRSVLYVPALNERALAKLAHLSCDAVIIDLEDAVAPSRKDEARNVLSTFLSTREDDGKEIAIRVNGLSTPWGRDDIALALSTRPDAILLPKVEAASDVLAASWLLDDGDQSGELAIWSMIETPRGLLEVGSIASLGREPGSRLDCLIAGTNDLVKDTGVRATADRKWLLPWLMQMVLAARAGGVDILDGVSNDFTDLEAFAAECAQGRDMGFDGKTLIHPAQIAAANLAFSPDESEIAEALAIRAAFDQPENAETNVITIDGRMVERLHLQQAERLLAKAGLQRKAT